MPMILRDYLYLDTERVQDYLSSLDPGITDEFKETVKEGSGREGNLGIKAHFLTAGGRSQSQEESIYETTFRIRAQNWFYRVYDQLKDDDAIRVYDEDEPIDLGADRLRRGDVVEITRNFAPSPLNKMIDQIFDLVDLMTKLGLTEKLGDEDTQQALSMMTMVFRGDHDDAEVPMVARASGQDTSVIFTAKSSFLLKSEEDFYGDMTVFGRVQRVVAAPAAVDLFDLLRMPAGLRRLGASEANIKAAILELFESWPEELGGPLDKEAIKVPGPALVVTPVAVYT